MYVPMALVVKYVVLTPSDSTILRSCRYTTPVGFKTRFSLSGKTGVGVTISVELSNTCAYRPSMNVPYTSVENNVVVPLFTSLVRIVDRRPVGCSGKDDSTGVEIFVAGSRIFCLVAPLPIA